MCSIKGTVCDCIPLVILAPASSDVNTESCSSSSFSFIWPRISANNQEHTTVLGNPKAQMLNNFNSELITNGILLPTLWKQSVTVKSAHRILTALLNPHRCRRSSRVQEDLWSPWLLYIHSEFWFSAFIANRWLFLKYLCQEHSYYKQCFASWEK